MNENLESSKKENETNPETDNNQTTKKEKKNSDPELIDRPKVEEEKKNHIDNTKENTNNNEEKSTILMSTQTDEMIKTEKKKKESIKTSIKKTTTKSKISDKKQLNKTKNVTKRDKNKTPDFKTSRKKGEEVTEFTTNETKKINFSSTYQRFVEEQEKRKQKITQMKIAREEKEKQIYSHQPKINRKSIEMVSNAKEDFFERQNKMLQEIKKKNEEQKEKIKKMENDKIKRTKAILNDKSVDSTVKKLYEWEEKRKEKILQKKQNMENIIKSSITTKPKIDKNSMKLAVTKNKTETFDRLYKDDVIKRKQKKVLLEQIYKPSFRPVLKDKFNSRMFNQKNKNLYNSKNYGTTTFNTLKTSFKEEDKSDDEIHSNKEGEEESHDEEEIENAFRSYILKKCINNRNKLFGNKKLNHTINVNKSIDKEKQMLNKTVSNSRNKDIISSNKKNDKKGKDMNGFLHSGKKNKNKIRIMYK